MEGDWECSPCFGAVPFFYTLFSCSCLLSIHSTIQSSNISVAACFFCCFTWFIWHPNLLGEMLCSLYIISFLHVPPSYLCHAYFCSCSQLIHFVSDPCFSVDYHAFSYYTASGCQTTNHIPYSYLLALLSLFEWFNCIITSFLGAHHCCYSHGDYCFFGNFLILWCSASLVLLFCLVSFPPFLTSFSIVVLLYELFINMYGLFVIHLIIT